MKIGISLNGEGRGHLTRISAIAKELLKNHDIIFWVPDTRIDEVRESFPGISLNRIPAFEISYTKMNQVDILKTGSKNISNVLGLSAVMNDIKSQLEFYKPDVVISDFEPIVPLASRKKNIPVIQFNHPSVVLLDKTLDYDAYISKFIAKRMCPHYDEMIISSFYNGDVGPIIRKEIKEAKKGNANFLLIYLRGNIQEKVISSLEKYKNMPYKIFPDKNKDFVSSLASCSGVITNGGHQLLSEAAYLNKPLFMLPIERQFEQKLNAKMMEKAGRGLVANYRNLDTQLIYFLKDLDKYKSETSSDRNFNFEDNTMEAVALLESKFKLHTKRIAS